MSKARIVLIVLMLFRLCLTHKEETVPKLLSDLTKPGLRMRLKSGGYFILDTELPKNGKRLSRWRIQQILSVQDLLFLRN